MDYTIRSGDTLSGIAQRMGTTVQALAQANGISNPDLIRAGATLRIPDAPGAAPAAAAPSPMAPTTGAMPRPRPQQVAAMDPMAAPLPQPNPMRGPPPLPPQNPTRPNVPGPPIDRGAPMQVGRDIPGYVPAGWRPVPGGPADVPPPVKPDAPVGNPMITAGFDPMKGGMPDFAAMSLRQLGDWMNAWVSTGRPLEEIPPEFQMVWQFRQEEAQRGAQQAGANLDIDRAQFRNQWGTDPRIAPPAPPVNASIGEGEYLPAEMIRLGQLGANMNNAPQANTMLPQLGLLSGPRRQQPTLGQLAYTGV